MQYTVWSRGELIGTTDLGFRGLGFDACRSGNFHPNERATEEMLEELASDSHCMRAYFHRDYRDANGNDILDPEYVNCDWFADVAEHLQMTQEFALELRDENNVVIPVLEIGIQDKDPDTSPPASEEQLAAYRLADKEHLERVEQEKQQRLALASVINPLDQKMLDDIIANDEEQMEGCEYFATPCDITMPVGWGYEDHQGDRELGSGWNATLRDLPDFPRYQIHVILAGV